MNRHSIISLSVIIALSCGSVNAFASNFMTMDEKATAIQSIRNEANQAMEDKQAALKAYNADRSPENMARLGDIENSLRTAGDRINAVQATETAPDAPRPVTQRTPQPLQQKTPHITGTTYRNAVISMQQVTTGPALPAGTAVNPPDATKTSAVAAPQITGTTYRAAVVSMQQATTGPALPAGTAVNAPSLTHTPATTKAPDNVTSVAITKDTGSINVAVSSMKPGTPVNITVNGVTTTTTAGEIAKVDPNVQIAVPHVDALIVSQRQGSDHSRNNSRPEHGTGNGSNNAANSNSAHGLGGGNHIGGGSAQSGSRNVGHW
ncbi:TPA: hypothetical protein QCI11_002948 [Enterobacter ludwigii]|nr:hypothetical protein [Enterobacter ludwigii]